MTSQSCVVCSVCETAVRDLGRRYWPRRRKARRRGVADHAVLGSDFVHLARQMREKGERVGAGGARRGRVDEDLLARCCGHGNSLVVKVKRADLSMVQNFALAGPGLDLE